MVFNVIRAGQDKRYLKCKLHESRLPRHIAEEDISAKQTGREQGCQLGTCCAGGGSWGGKKGGSTVQGVQKGRFASNVAHLQAFSPIARLSAEGACCCRPGAPSSSPA